ncbi:DUF3850 domain-containing protein [bacterium]|nr:DUF3850 domain-containing protein [bacterium]
MRKTHTLKLWPEYYSEVKKENMNFQLRENDRDFQKGDNIILQEWDNKKKKYTRRELYRHIDYILPGGNLGLPQNLCILGISSTV